MSVTNPNLQVSVAGQAINIQEVFEIDLRLDLNEPDMGSLILSNIQANRSAQLSQGAPVEVKADGKPIFKGELTGLEPQYDYGLPSRCTIRALNKMHRLSHGKKSRTF